MKIEIKFVEKVWVIWITTWGRIFPPLVSVSNFNNFRFNNLFRLKHEASYFDWFNMTENGLEYDRKNSHRQTWTGEYDRKITTTNMNWSYSHLEVGHLSGFLKFFDFGHIYLLMFVVVIHFWSSSIVLVCRCDLFGHVQIFWSYSFGHVDSVKWFTLLLRPQ